MKLDESHKDDFETISPPLMHCITLPVEGTYITVRVAASIFIGETKKEDVTKVVEEILRNNKLLQAIKDHHAQKADDRCIEDDDKLYAAAGLPPCDRRVGDKADMLVNCARFIEKRCEGGGWPSYAELEAERDRLKDVLRRVKTHAKTENDYSSDEFEHYRQAILDSTEALK